MDDIPTMTFFLFVKVTKSTMQHLKLMNFGVYAKIHCMNYHISCILELFLLIYTIMHGKIKILKYTKILEVRF